MATIELYADKVKQMPGLIQDVKKAVKNYNSELFSLKKKSLRINQSVCNMDDVVSSIQASTQTQEEKIESLETFKQNSEQFIEETAGIDSDVADVINKNKDYFYDKYDYLKPECEKSGWEKFCDGCKKVGEWCKEHWKLIVTVVLVVAAIAVIVFTAGTALGPITAALVMAAKGVIVGSTIGGLVGGTINALAGDSFFEGFEDGAFGGAIAGGLTGGIGTWLSSGGQVALSLGKTMLLGASADTVASLLGDLGDIAIKGEDISLGDILFNAGFSFVLGGAFVAGGYGLGKILPKISIPGINQGNGSWAHVWASQSTRSLRHGTKVSLKTILKGIGSNIVNEVWDYILEPFKTGIGKWKESWNIIPAN